MCKLPRLSTHRFRCNPAAPAHTHLATYFDKFFFFFFFFIFPLTLNYYRTTVQHCHPILARKPPPLTCHTNTAAAALTSSPPQPPPLNCGAPPIRPPQLPLSPPLPQPRHSTTTPACHAQALTWCYLNMTRKAPPPPTHHNTSPTWRTSPAAPHHNLSPRDCDSFTTPVCHAQALPHCHPNTTHKPCPALPR